jgi:hypothetical protein
MAFIIDQQNQGSFIPTTGIFEVGRLFEVDVDSPEFKELLARLYQAVNNIANVLNIKDTGYYLESEFTTGALYFNPASDDPNKLRPVFRKVIDMGALAAGVTTVAHGLTIGTTWKFVHIYGAASGTPNYYPLPFVSAGGATNIEVRVDLTNVIVTNNSGVVFTSSTVVLEYVKE